SGEVRVSSCAASRDSSACPAGAATRFGDDEEAVANGEARAGCAEPTSMVNALIGCGSDCMKVLGGDWANHGIVAESS
ncbi:hypothetical protein B8W95_13640, partial [Staphylococcus pasteuri]